MPMNDVPPQDPNPFAVTERPLSAFATSEQSRAAAEVQAEYVIAKRFPRDERKAMDKILQACTRPGLAEAAVYAYAKGGNEIQGPSIRMAEALALAWGNIKFGWKELSRGVGPDNLPFSQVQAYARDLETNVPAERDFIVKHWRDKRGGGGYVIKEERELYELCANMAARRMRACILNLIPGDVIEAALNQVEVTLKTKAEVTPERLGKMLEAFANFGVTKKMIEERIQRKLEAMTPALLLQMMKIHNSLRDGMSTADEWFEMPTMPVAGTAGQSGAAAPAQAAAPRKVEKPPIPAEKFAAELPKWRAMVAKAPAMAEQIIRMQESKYLLTDEQKAQIKGTGNANPAG
jgi:hypothetical protein